MGQVEECQMEFIVSGIVALLLLGYLTHAMFNPDKFD
jgi:K+-transporting ATPase KdpF subunit